MQQLFVLAKVLCPDNFDWKISASYVTYLGFKIVIMDVDGNVKVKDFTLSSAVVAHVRASIHSLCSPPSFAQWVM